MKTSQFINNKKEIVFNPITEETLNLIEKYKKTSRTILLLTFIGTVVCGTLAVIFKGQAVSSLFANIFVVTTVFLVFLIEISFSIKKEYATLAALEIKSLKDTIKDNSELFSKGIVLYKTQGFIIEKQKNEILEIYKTQQQEKLVKEAEEEIKACLDS